jgi:hypothetical protein
VYGNPQTIKATRDVHALVKPLVSCVIKARSASIARFGRLLAASRGGTSDSAVLPSLSRSHGVPLVLLLIRAIAPRLRSVVFVDIWDHSIYLRHVRRTMAQSSLVQRQSTEDTCEASLRPQAKGNHGTMILDKASDRSIYINERAYSTLNSTYPRRCASHRCHEARLRKRGDPARHVGTVQSPCLFPVRS